MEELLCEVMLNGLGMSTFDRRGIIEQMIKVY